MAKRRPSAKRAVRVYPRNRTPSVVIATTLIMMFFIAGAGLGAWLTVTTAIDVLHDPSVLLDDVGRARVIPGFVALIGGALLTVGCLDLIRRNAGFLKELYVGRVELRRARRPR